MPADPLAQQQIELAVIEDADAQDDADQEEDLQMLKMSHFHLSSRRKDSLSLCTMMMDFTSARC